ncbi:MAG: plastocyanin/azurin family copper-binding protein [Solirubrobacteraceae bacterium]
MSLHAFVDPPARARRRAGEWAPRLAASGLLVALALGTAGCSVKGADNPNVILGKQQFVAKCGSCHTLARAESKGIIGPNLDEAFRASLAEGLERNTVRGIVEGQVMNPNPEGAMPKDLAGGATLKDIAAYVSQSVDRSGKDTGLLATAVPLPGAGKPAVEKAGKLEIEANPTGQLAYTTDKATASAGTVTITMANMSGVMHNIAIQQGTSGAVLGASTFISKGTTSVKVTLKPGTYTYFCQVPGHRTAGMLGTLTVK